MITTQNLGLTTMPVPDAPVAPAPGHAAATRAARGACAILLVADRVPSLRTGSTHKVYRGWRLAVVMQHGQPRPGTTLFAIPVDPTRLAAGRTRYALAHLANADAVVTGGPVAFSWSASATGTADPFAAALAQAQRQLAAAGWTPDAADPTRYAKTGPTLAIGEGTTPPASATAPPVAGTGDTTDPGPSQRDPLSVTTLSPDEEPGLDGWAMDGGACATVSERPPAAGSGEHR